MSLWKAWDGLKNWIVNSSFARAVGVLVGGAAVAQSLSILAAPVLTRLYEPSDYGVLAVYFALLQLLLGVAALRFEFAIPLPERNSEAADLVVLALILVICSCLLAGGAVAAGGGWIAALVRAPELEPYLWLLPVGLLGAGVFEVLSYWTIRQSGFAILARTRMAQGISRTSVQLGLGVFGLAPVGLLLGEVCGRMAGLSTLGRMIRRQAWPLIRSVRPRGIAQVARRYRRFATFSSSSVLAEAGATFLPAAFISAAFGIEIAGWFALMQHVIFMPIGLIANAVTQAFIGSAARAGRGDAAALRRIFFKTAAGLAAIAAIPAGVLALAAPWLFSLVFGAEWTGAGAFASLMAPAFFMIFVMTPLLYTLNILERQDIILIWNIGRFALIVAALIVLPRVGASPMETVAAYSGAVTIAYAVFFAVCVRQTRLAANTPVTAGESRGG